MGRQADAHEPARPGNLHRRETRLGKHDIGSTTGSVSGALDSDTNVGSGERRGVVRPVASHRAQMSKTLKTLHNFIFVLREHTRKAIRVHDHLVQGSVFAARLRAVLEHLGRVHVVAEAEATSGLLCDSELVARDHLDFYAEPERIVDGLFGVLARRIEDGEQADELKAVALRLMVLAVQLLVCNSECAQATRGKLFDVGLELVLDLLGLVAGAELDDDTGHALGDALDLARRLLAICNFSTLVDGVERLEIEELDAGTGTGGVTDRADDTGIDGVLVLSAGGVCGEKHNVVGGEGTVSAHDALVDGELVGCEGASLVGAQDGDTRQFLDGGDTGDNSLVLGELLGADCEGDGENRGHGNGDTADQEDKDVVKTAAVGVPEAGVQDENLGNDEDANSDKTEGANLGENLLQVTGGVVVLADERGGATEEGVWAGGYDDTLGLALFAGRAAAAAGKGKIVEKGRVGLTRSTGHPSFCSGEAIHR